ncbi:MAG: zinc-binding alcohol dehydrogenase family protein [Acidobacteriota bacterium]
MRTVTLEEPGRLSLGDSALPGKPPLGEAVVRVLRVGVCGTDIHAFRGEQPFFSYPRILGHELGVEIADIGPNATGLRVGDLCAVEPYLDCGRCIACRQGKTNCCVNLKVLGVHTDGGMQEFITLPTRKLHRSERLTPDQLAWGETVGIGAHAVARARLQAGEFVLVIGAGPIGQGVINFAQLAGARVIVIDVSEERLEFARQRGVENTLQGRDDPLSRVKEITEGNLATAVFDATGNAGSMSKAFDYVAHAGRLVLVGLIQGDVTFSDPDFHRKEMTILSSRNATGADFARILRLLESGKIDPTVWATHRASAASFVEEFPRWIEPGAGLVKGLIEF